MRPSRTLATAIANAIGERVKISTTIVDIGAIWNPISALASPRDAIGDVRGAFDAVENADLLIAASPIIKASYARRIQTFF
jgi:FMN reductase